MRKVKTSIWVRLLLILLIPLAMFLNFLFGKFPQIGERLYSARVNKWFIQGLSHVTGILPFSLFEWCIYLVVVLLILYTLYTLYRMIRYWRQFYKPFLSYVLNIAVFVSIGFFVYTSFWALNYKRPHFSDKYGIVAGDYTPEELGELYAFLLDQAATIRPLLPEDEMGLMTTYGDHKDIFNRAKYGYEVVMNEFPTLKGSYGKAKAILASEPLNYTGITGIYSPFTGEPNVNISVPIVTLPSTTCHEMAHQRGYGFENEIGRAHV